MKAALGEPRKAARPGAAVGSRVRAARAGEEGGGGGAEEGGGPGDVVGLADAADGGAGLDALEQGGVFPQGLREVGPDQAGGDAVDADAGGAELDGEVADELHVGGLRDVVGAEPGVAAQAADARDDDDRAVLALAHPGRDAAREPQVGEHVVVHDLGEDLVGEAEQRAEVRVARGVADQDVDAAPLRQRGVDQLVDLGAVRDVAGDDQGLAAGVADARRDGLAGLALAARDDDAGARAGHGLGDRAADAAARAGDDGDFSGEVDDGGHALRVTMPRAVAAGKGVGRGFGGPAQRRRTEMTKGPRREASGPSGRA